MFTQSVYPASAIALPERAVTGSMWCAFNPNVDRSAPPRPSMKKAAKKKPAPKKPAKGR